MKTFYTLLILLLGFMSPLIGQSVCDQYIAMLKKPNTSPQKKRAFRMTTQISGDPHINYTEYDTFGRIHFWGHVGSLKIESFYADGKRYSKIQSDYIKDDEWTFQEVQTKDSSATKWAETLRNDAQNIDCQLIGEEKIKSKTYKILAYTIQKNMPKRNGVDSFLMDMKVKTWFCVEDSSVYKYAYETTTERLTQTIKSTLEYDVPVKIDIPKNAKQEEQRKIMLTQNPPDSIKKEIKLVKTDSIKIGLKSIQKPVTISQTDSSQTKDTATIYTVFDQTPEYKDGMAALLTYISNNMHYPEDARKAGIDGTVHVGFVVEMDGKLSNIHIKRGLREDIDAEAKRIIESMSGAWKTGKVNGKEVRSAYTLPLKFELRE